MMSNSLDWDRSTYGLKRMTVYRTAAMHLTDLLIVIDRTGRFLLTEASSGRVPEFQTQEELFAWIHPDDKAETERVLFYMKACSFRFRRKEGEWGWMEAIRMPLTDEGDEFVVIALRDISSQKQEAQDLRRMAFHDPLTGLPNRRLFEEHLSQSIAHSKRNGQLMAVFYIDIDNFKLINDGLGHECGDQFLIAFAKRIKGCVREIDTFARMGGDEFTILLPIVDSAISVEKIARRIMNAIKKGWEIVGARINTTASMGIALYPSDEIDADLLLSNVDKALYEVKAGGRNGYKFFNK